jgi:hypothetical protein
MNIVVFSGELLLSGLAIYALWCLIRDYAGIFQRSPPLVSPVDWTLLEKGDIPAASADGIAKEKDRLFASSEVHAVTQKCTVTSLSDVRPVR